MAERVLKKLYFGIVLKFVHTCGSDRTEILGIFHEDLHAILVAEVTRQGIRTLPWL